MTLRKQQIEAAIASAAGDPAKAAVAVCKVLEDEIGLDGNGWWDNDPELRALLGVEAE
jgi:hypothetical protein